MNSNVGIVPFLSEAISEASHTLLPIISLTI